MAADEYGNDVSAVGIPVTGAIGIAPAGTAIPTPIEGANPDYALPAAFEKIGLIKEDGGPQLAWEADGDPITFWQDGYSIPSGLANVTLTFTAAQTDETVREIIYGKTADANHYLEVDGGGNTNTYVAYTEEIFKNGVIRRRILPNVTVGAVEEDQSTRGEVLGYAITLNVARSTAVNNHHWGEWLLPADAVPPVADAQSTTKSTTTTAKEPVAA